MGHVELRDKIIKSIQEEDLKTAKSLIQNLLDENPRDIFALSNLGFIEYMNDSFLECKRINELILSIEPSNVYASKGLGLSLIKLNMFEEGEKSLLRAIDLNPEYFDPYYDLAVSYYERGMFDEAKELIKKATPKDAEEESLVNDIVDHVNKISKLLE